MNFSTPIAFVVGLVAGLLIVAWNRCLFLVHPWGRWTVAKNGGGQVRGCPDCGLLEVKTFNGFIFTREPNPPEL